MKAEIEARIAALEAELAAERAKLQTWIEAIPAEFHHITSEVWAKMKSWFEPAPAAAPAAAPVAEAAPSSTTPPAA